ncbi:hypothetical protein GGTG_12990 [Gaeumannomyces tritici R3-111a-1]|uniref:AAA+ ATPase domain-containing protein n=1 Tax=Gaeumannomyces tritici (strain R3-111a-1) TaxID=644352 RepID=J3PHL0_GAET3|nr:hypothetical protein GGTG_12990 [Gaeumannomyces tritici R3-111a-1]EJT69371.1 hypothetical protein GGTG_12990 [Gaeumannomyces tritici R3-111a-1]
MSISTDYASGGSATPPQLNPSVGILGKRRQAEPPTLDPILPADQIGGNTVALRPEKRHRHSGHLNEQPAIASVIIHTVLCPRSADGHKRHGSRTLFLDQPRLFGGDTKASALRGRHPANDDIDDYLAADSTSFVVVRNYDCAKFHKSIQDSFTRFPLPVADHEAPAEAQPYFYFLEHDTTPAEPLAESFLITPAFEDAMGELVKLEPLPFAEWQAALKSPYLHAFHTRQRMQILTNECLDEKGAAYVLSFLAYTEGSFGAQYCAAEHLFSQGLVTREHFNKLFGPNEVVVSIEGGEPEAFVATVCHSSFSSQEVQLDCYHWSFDGAFHKQEKDLRILWPVEGDGPIRITDLSTYPLRYDSTGELTKTLRERGNMFWSCRQRRFLGYADPKPSSGQLSNPRYMIDLVTYQDLHSNQQDQLVDRRDDLGKDMVGFSQPPKDPFVLLLPSKILGFGLHDKKWRTLLVKHLHPIKWNKKAFERLVLDSEKKELIEAMVRVHVSSSMSTDVIEGKGNGLIILLHGGPGTGKTLTAESVAELAEKPLYRVTCGDVGTDPESVETYLERVLNIGSTWGAVLLLDESDVFLEEREKTDLQRNALVSVFLRALEYYEGILILTSNRVGIFDEAFKSRVQLALHYPPLDYNGRREIWNSLICLLRQQQDGASTGLAEGESFNIDELRDKLDILAKENLNGRQIRNAITTARQLARFREKPLGYAHLSQTIRIANEFEAYVEKTHGHNAGEYARGSGVRLE